MSAHPLATMDDENPTEGTGNARDLTKERTERLKPYRFQPGAKPGPGRPPLSSEERAKRAALKSLEQHLLDMGPIAAVRLLELMESDDETVAASTAKFVAERSLELQSRQKPAARMTVTMQEVAEAQRLLTGGEDDGQEQG